MEGNVLVRQKKAGVALCIVLLVLAQQVSGAPGWVDGSEVNRDDRDGFPLPSPNDRLNQH